MTTRGTEVRRMVSGKVMPDQEEDPSRRMAGGGKEIEPDHQAGGRGGDDTDQGDSDLESPN